MIKKTKEYLDDWNTVDEEAINILFDLTNNYKDEENE